MTAAYKSLKAAVYEALENAKENGEVIVSPGQEAVELMDYCSDIPEKVRMLLADIVKEWQIEQEKSNGR